MFAADNLDADELRAAAEKRRRTARKKDLRPPVGGAGPAATTALGGTGTGVEGAGTAAGNATASQGTPGPGPGGRGGVAGGEPADKSPVAPPGTSGLTTGLPRCWLGCVSLRWLRHEVLDVRIKVAHCDAPQESFPKLQVVHELRLYLRGRPVKRAVGPDDDAHAALGRRNVRGWRRRWRRCLAYQLAGRIGPEALGLVEVQFSLIAVALLLVSVPPLPIRATLRRFIRLWPNPDGFSVVREWPCRTRPFSARRRHDPDTPRRTPGRSGWPR